jgi:ABC-type multidrug transport system fused ATPase/permease subunit
MNKIGSRYVKLYKNVKKAFGEYRLHVFILLILGFISGILEGLGINALIPLFSFAIDDSDMSDNIITQYLRMFFYYVNIDFSLKFLLIFICILFVLKALILLLFNYISVRITTSFETKTRTQLFGKFLKADWPFLLEQKLGHLENVLMNDVRISALMLQQITAVIMIITSLLIYTIVAFSISFQTTIYTLLLGAIIFLTFKPFAYKIKEYSRKASNVNKQVAHFINENIIGLKAVKAMNKAREVENRGENLFIYLKKLRIKRAIIVGIPKNTIQPIAVIFISAVFAITYKTSGDNFNFAALIAVVYLIQRIFLYSENLQTRLYNLYEYAPYLTHVLDYKDKTLKYYEKDSGQRDFCFSKNLEFKNIYFSYNENKVVISDLNFRINKGEMIGLIGPSGAGKTTIVDLMLRLLNPDRGNILLDSVDIKDIGMSQWRNNIGYVSQDLFLQNDTIANNIRFYDNSISEEDIIIAAKQANIYDLIISCEQKFDTVIGERGILLSAGQRQRIVIARILARKPEILILDEATSALDKESEIKIQKVIENLKRSITVFVIAHRLSTVENCDRLLVLDNGKIIEKGKPEDLIKNKNSYFYKVKNLR